MRFQPLCVKNQVELYRLRVKLRKEMLERQISPEMISRKQARDISTLETKERMLTNQKEGLRRLQNHW